MRDQRNDKLMIRRTVLTLATLAVAISMTACSHAMMMIHGTGAKRPAASEFGLGPRLSAEGRYVATLDPARPLRPRQMQTVRVTVRDAEGRAIDEAQISVDGGMPQHGHGLPTRPRVTRNLGDGIYEIEGVRFNMGAGGSSRSRLRVPAVRTPSRSTWICDSSRCHDQPHLFSSRTGPVGDDHDRHGLGPWRVDKRASRRAPIDVARRARVTPSRSHESRGR